MANTMVAPVGNDIDLAAKFLARVDEVYKRESLTNLFDTESDRVQWTGADTVNLFEIETVGLGNYSRNAGFVPGDANGSWKPYKLTQDRGRSFNIDAMDSEETLGLMGGRTLATFERTQVVPEIDAYRFAQWAGATGVDGTSAAISASAAAVAAIDTATASMDDNEVPYEGRVLFVNPTFYRYLKGGIERRVMNGENDVNYNIEYYNDMRIISVPSGRFNTAVTINAATASSDAGGYTAGGSAINFMIVHPTAIMQVVKHNPIRIFSPEQNIESDAYRINYRLYHDTFVLENKVKGIYVHKATA